MKQNVIHKLYGNGTVFSIDGASVSIMFENPAVGTKKFVYPDAFSQHLQYTDEGSQKNGCGAS
ncbi:hypothetical protein LJC27_06705 [Christensenellaceae bacterium OttesenSCG-928-M15]|nr:hypothetical protein [Christensenellaceae bacterium OttesenSCG-928-M15]